MFLSETYDPGWRAFINDSEAKIFKTNYLYQSILLPSGQNGITFKYDPFSFRMGKRLFYLGFVVLTIGFVVSYAHFRKLNSKNAKGKN